MYNKIISVIIAIVSIVGIYFSSKIPGEENITTATNYMDIRFVDVSSRNSSNVYIDNNGSGIQLKTIDFEDGKEVITYLILNNSSYYDVNMSVLINGSTFYDNDYYSITCSELGRVNKGEVIEGYITIKLKDDITESFSIPFNIEIEASPIEKKYLF